MKEPFVINKWGTYNNNNNNNIKKKKKRPNRIERRLACWSQNTTPITQDLSRTVGLLKPI
jgi:hypothetical protein